MFERILIANRGEIAVRVIAACKEMGITPIAVYSDVDRRSLHVLRAHEAWPLGGAESRESYLSIDRVMHAVRESRADAVHPGYGFLAENADFARACREAGVAFVGPSEEAIRAMGDKLEARARMREAGVPVVPGSEGAVDDPAEAARVAERIGLPVMLKAAAGGGGKGMRIVRDADELAPALERTMAEAQSAFGNPAVYVEKYVERPRHIEVQVMGLADGRVVTWGERECSMQRRHQKVIEESPAPGLAPETRAALCDAARRAAEAVDYRGAGTVEFIADRDGNFWFLEMNTRLQVEHPVTEAVWGIDLVRQQIRVAANEPIEDDPDAATPRGHAIELRVYAEDPSRGFMPAVGRITRLALPQGPGVRTDSGVYAGWEIPVYYDPLIAKVTVWAPTREQALRRARRALREFRADGVRTNVDFLLWALSEPEFAEGAYDTGTIERRFDPGSLSLSRGEAELAAAAAALAAWREHQRTRIVGDPDEAGRRWRHAARTGALRWGRDR